MNRRFRQPTPLRRLAHLRIATYGLWLIVLVRTETAVYDTIALELVEPKGIARLLPVRLVMESGTVGALRVAAIIGCVACLVGAKPYRVVSFTTMVALLTFDGVVKSFGAWTNHALSGLVLMALLLPFTPAAEELSLQRRRGRRADLTGSATTALQLAALALTGAYSLIGSRRLIAGGAEVFTTDATLVWVSARSHEWAEYGFGLGQGLSSHGWALPALAVAMLATTVFECLSPLALISNRFRIAWLLVIVPFHLTTLFTMRIFFWENLVLIAVLFWRPVPMGSNEPSAPAPATHLA